MVRKNSRIFHVGIAIGSLLLLGGCGATGSFGGVRFDASVPSGQQSLLIGDLTMLAGSNYDSAAAAIRNETTQILGTGDLSGATLNRWFAERVQLMFGESFDWAANSYNVNADSKSVTVMFNLGSHLYLQAVRNGSYYGVQTDQGFIAATSPRVGLVQIGAGMFTDNQITSSGLESQANRGLRLAVMMHEARHSDGNGDDAGFPHAMCTSGAYSGRYACDAYQNGPYQVQAYTAAMFAYACTQCTQTEYQVLLSFIGDYASRLQPNARYADPTPVQYY